MKTNKKSIKFKCLVAIIILLTAFIATPYRVYAYEEDAIKLNIDTSEVRLKDVWGQIKNAAFIHLVSEKMKTCIEIGQVVGDNGGTRWPRTSDLLGIIKGVLDKGNVFKTDAIWSDDFNTNIGVGPWMSSLFKGQKDGIIECNDWTGKEGNLFDMFVWLLKSYHSEVTASELEGASVTMGDRLMVVCSPDENGQYTLPGFLAPSDDFGNIKNNINCNDPRVSFYTGVSKDKQIEYISKLYEDMRRNSGNEYILPWDALDSYNEVDGYYLYSLDFEAQCSSIASFSKKKDDEAGYQYVEGFEITDSGRVKKGYYKIKTNGDTARQSFVARKYTCVQLATRMGELVGPYIKKINIEVYNVCKEGVDEVINQKRDEINEKYLKNDSATDEEIADAKKVIQEYNNIQSAHKYVAVIDDDGNENIVESPSFYNPPSNVLWVCRSHLPFIDVIVEEEAELSEAAKNKFYDECYEVMDLAWVVCPVANWISNVVDDLTNAIDEAF